MHRLNPTVNLTHVTKLKVDLEGKTSNFIRTSKSHSVVFKALERQTQKWASILQTKTIPIKEQMTQLIIE